MTTGSQALFFAPMHVRDRKAVDIVKGVHKRLTRQLRRLGPAASSDFGDNRVTTTTADQR